MMMHGWKDTQPKGGEEAAQGVAAASLPGWAFGQAAASRVWVWADGDVLAPAQVPGFARVSSGGAAYVMFAADIVATVVAFAPPVVVTTGTRTLRAGAAGKAGNASDLLKAGQAPQAETATAAPTTALTPGSACRNQCLQLRRSGASLESGQSRSGLASCGDTDSAGQTGEAGQDGGAKPWRLATKGEGRGRTSGRPKQPDVAPPAARHRPSGGAP